MTGVGLEPPGWNLHGTRLFAGYHRNYRWTSGTLGSRSLTVDFKARAVERWAVQLECVFFGPFRDAVGEKTVRYETEAETVGDLLTDLEAAFPGLEGELVADDGDGFAGDTVVTKGGRNVVHIKGLTTPLEDGDVIRLVPSVYGG